jgi:lysophospholipase L1-like esterase
MMRKPFSVSVLACCLIIMGILGNPWVVARYLTRDGSLDFHTRTVVLILDFLVILLGLIIWSRRRSWGARQIGYLLVTTVITLAVVETGLQVLCIIKNRVVVDVRMLHSSYKNEPWGKEYWREYRSAGYHYEPFVLWNANPFRGKWINIDQDGRRKTWRPSGANPPNPEEIYVLGGSAVWGIGARDDYTIPSNLSKLLNTGNHKYLVTNYGIPGFTFLQEIIKLTLLLQNGQRPDFIVFYDGANDVYAAYQSGRMVDFLDYRDTQEKLENSPLTQGMKYLIAKCRIVQAVEKTLAFVGLQPNYREGAASFTDQQLEALEKDIVKNYKKSAVLLKNLSEIYKFNYALFWQPVIFMETSVVEDEIKFDPHCQDKNLAKLFKKVRGHLVNAAIPHWVDLSEALRRAPKPAYIDFCHLTEPGYAEVSAKMAAIVKEELKSDKFEARQLGP